MNQKIDRAWLSLFFSIPGSLLALLGILLYTGVTYSRSGTGNAGLSFALWSLLLVPLHFVFLIPAWLVLRKSENKVLAIRTKIFFDLLTLFIVFPVLVELIGDLSSHAWRERLITLTVGAAIVIGFLSFGWFLLYKKFGKLF